MEIIILNDYARVTGGSTAVALASALGLCDRGFKVTLFTCVGPVAPNLVDHPNLEIICLDQPEIGRDPNRARAMAQGLRNGPAVKRLTELLAGKDPAETIVHLHTWTKALSPFAAVLAAQKGFPLVVTLHDFFITCPTGGFFLHRQGALCHHRPLSLGCVSCNCDRRNYGHKLWRVLRTVLQNQILKLPAQVSHFIGVSGFSLDVMRPYLPTHVPVSVIRNPIEFEQAPPVSVAQNSDFVFVGRLEDEKGARLFAAATREAGVPGHFIGDGALTHTLKKDFPELVFHGWLQPAQIRRALSTARALVFPPLWYETLGMVVVEAASMGIPVIISNSCAATDFIENESTGLYFDHGSIPSLAKQMLRLRNHPEDAHRLGQAAYRWYWDAPWTTEHHVEKLIEVYQAILERRSNPSHLGTNLSIPVEAS